MSEEIFIKAEELHEKAMDLSDQAAEAKVNGDEPLALEFLNKATANEIKAANLLPAEEDYEPSRSILYRSAATLAFEAGEFKLADRLVAMGLSGFPPREVENELKDLYEDINFRRHAEAEGINISEDGFIVTVSGQATKHGGALIDLVLSRVGQFQTAFYRTVERLLGAEYRTDKVLERTVKENFPLYLDTQFASSFGLYLLVGSPTDQYELFPELKEKGEIDGKTVVEEIMSCLKILESQQPEELKNKIIDEDYYDDFIGFAKRIAPDGEQVNTVAIRSSNSQNNSVFLRKTKKQLKRSIPIPTNENDEVMFQTFRGLLKQASTPLKGKFGNVGLYNFDTRERVNIKVPKGMMKNTVQPYYEENVIISVYKKKREILFRRY